MEKTETGIIIAIVAVLVIITAFVLNKLSEHKNTSPKSEDADFMETEASIDEAPATSSAESAKKNFTKTETTATVLLKFAIAVILTLSLIGGIMIGIAMKTPTISDFSDISYEWGVASTFSMLATWASGGVVSILIYSKIETIRLLCGLQDKSKEISSASNNVE